MKDVVWPLCGEGGGSEESEHPLDESPPVSNEYPITEGDESEIEVIRRLEDKVKELPITPQVGRNKPDIIPRKSRRNRVADPVEASVVVMEVGDECLDVVEEGGDFSEGDAGSEGFQDGLEVKQPDRHEDLTSTLNRLTGKQPREKLVRLTSIDKSLEAARRLAQEGKNGYSWSDGLLFRHRLEALGKNYRQLCLLQEYMVKCMSLSHECFGHRGKQKCAEDIMP